MTRLPQLTDDELGTIVNALHVARGVYRRDARQADGERLRAQFERQAEQVMRLLDKIEEADRG